MGFLAPVFDDETEEEGQDLDCVRLAGWGFWSCCFAAFRRLAVAAQLSLRASVDPGWRFLHIPNTTIKAGDRPYMVMAPAKSPSVWIVPPSSLGRQMGRWITE
jgi:hypothetical protein